MAQGIWSILAVESSGKSENFHFNGLLLSKACSLWAKKITDEACREKWFMVSKVTWGIS